MTAKDIEMIQTAEKIVCKGNGRVFVSVDKVLEIIEKRSYGGSNINYDQIKADVLRLKGGEQE